MSMVMRISAMPKSSVVALFLALACFSRDTAADWQGTLWNSSPEQTDQAFLVPHRNPTRLEFQYYFGEARIVFDDYQIDDLAFHKGHLNFQDGKLYQIWMELKEARLCEKLMADLKLTYGTPVVEIRLIIPLPGMTWKIITKSPSSIGAIRQH